MKVYWTPEAMEDRLKIWEFIAEDKPVAATNLDLKFSETALLLSQNLKLGRKGIIPGTRELFPHPNYRLVYEVVEDSVWVLALVHAFRHWP